MNTAARPDVVGAEVRALIRTALEEDLRLGPDITTAATVDPTARTNARIMSRADGVLAGLDFALAVFDELIGDDYRVVSRRDDGESIAAGDVVLEIQAPTAHLLTAERTALNLLTHLSGIATETARWVAAVLGTNAVIRDTRKTLPGLRSIEKYAVRAGGGQNHRMALGDVALIKDNHIAAAGSLTAALAAVRAHSPDIAIEVEVDTLEQLDEALALGAELILLDNFALWETQIAVQRRNARRREAKLESSGGLSLSVAGDYARTGVDYLAVGALTHSVRALDLGLDL